MRRYILTIYWCHTEGRSSCGVYPFDASDDAGALAYARTNLEEQIELADQSVLCEQGGRLVWENQWPVRGDNPRIPSA